MHDVKNILGAMLFGAKKPLTPAEIRRVFNEVAGMRADPELPTLRDDDVRRLLAELRDALASASIGIMLTEAGGGYRLQTDQATGPWLRCLLDLGKPTRLSRPALETLAIIAYRQPATRAEIEGVRGVSVDAMLRMLLEMQLIRIVGRSDLPGRPLLYATTQLFLEHFGLKDVRDLPGIEQLCREEAQRCRAAEAAAACAEGVEEVEDGEANAVAPPADREQPEDSDGGQ